jgi:hypothetical protein
MQRVGNMAISRAVMEEVHKIIGILKEEIGARH